MPKVDISRLPNEEEEIPIPKFEKVPKRKRKFDDKTGIRKPDKKREKKSKHIPKREIEED